jgi:glyoxalase family protein
MEADMAIGGIHHITAIAGTPSRNMYFYREVLGMRLVKQTVNYEDPSNWHLYFGDALGGPGSILTFFPYMRAIPGEAGPGQAVDVALSVPAASLDWWVMHLEQAGVAASGPRRRFGESFVAFEDPDGLHLELVADEAAGSFPGWGGGPVPVGNAIRGIHGVSLWVEHADETAALLTDRLGYRALGEEAGTRRFIKDGVTIGRVLDIKAQYPGTGHLGAGTVHHVAFRVSSDGTQAKVVADLVADGLAVTEQKDRTYFRSVYFREPSGIIFELATEEPGFAIDEPAEDMGTTLALPHWLESRRQAIVSALPSLIVPAA